MKAFVRDIDYHLRELADKRPRLVEAKSIVFQAGEAVREWERQIIEARETIASYQGKVNQLQNECDFHESEAARLEEMRKEEIRANRTEKKKSRRRASIKDIRAQMADLQRQLEEME